MLEVNCDDSLDVMKRLREHRAVIIRDNRHDRERRRGGERENTGGGKTRWTGESATVEEASRRKEKQRVLSPSQ